MALHILHTNDFHGTLDDARQEVLSRLRPAADLYFDSGDCVKAGNLAIPLKPETVWSRLAALECTASVIGNRESQPLEGPFKKKIEGAAHPVLCANMRRKDGSRPLSESLVLEVGGFRVGVFGVMVPMVTERMASRVASQFLWDDPLLVALRWVEELRPQVDCLIALTHIGIRQDEKLAEQCPGIDLILGGHSHTVLDVPIWVGKTAICQTGSHGRYAGVCSWSPGGLEYRLEALSGEVLAR